MDFETVVINNQHIPYLLSWSDGEHDNSYRNKGVYNENISTFNDMILQCMDDICRDKYKNYKIYFHNFSRFDGNFLVKYLSKIGKCSPVIHNNKIISLRFTYQNYTITFKDSYLLLPASLRKLGKAFNVETHKSIFPYLLPDINYKGHVPDFKYFTDISIEEYNKYKDSFKGKEWNFRAESTLYCVKDCISLHQVLSKFQMLVKDKFQLNINKYLTLPSLAFKIFRTFYLNKTDNTIHMLSEDISNDIRQSYTGGSVDMFIPVPRKKKKKRGKKGLFYIILYFMYCQEAIFLTLVLTVSVLSFKLVDLESSSSRP